MLDIVSSKTQYKRPVDTVSSRNSRKRILEAAVDLITKRGEADVTMADLARAARVSRQAVYLHFADRAALMLALVRYVDEKRGLEKELGKIRDAPSGVAAVREIVALQARMNPAVWAVARAVDAVRRTDEAAQRGWQDRLENRLAGCQEVVARLAKEGQLRADLDASTAADLLWAITSLRMWEDLVLQRGWSSRRYVRHLIALLLATLTKIKD